MRSRPDVEQASHPWTPRLASVPELSACLVHVSNYWSGSPFSFTVPDERWEESPYCGSETYLNAVQRDQRASRCQQQPEQPAPSICRRSRHGQHNTARQRHGRHTPAPSVVAFKCQMTKILAVSPSSKPGRFVESTTPAAVESWTTRSKLWCAYGLPRVALQHMSKVATHSVYHA
jgi:hypothetical protein